MDLTWWQGLGLVIVVIALVNVVEDWLEERREHERRVEELLRKRPPLVDLDDW